MGRLDKCRVSRMVLSEWSIYKLRLGANNGTWYVYQIRIGISTAMSLTGFKRWKTRPVYKLHIEGILSKGPYPPCSRVADRALLAGYPRYTGSRSKTDTAVVLNNCVLTDTGIFVIQYYIHQKQNCGTGLWICSGPFGCGPIYKESASQMASAETTRDSHKNVKNLHKKFSIETCTCIGTRF